MAMTLEHSHQPMQPYFHTLVCRHQPAWTIGAKADMSGLRDQFRHRPATPTTVARTTTAQGRKRNVALGLVPSQGWGEGTDDA